MSGEGRPFSDTYGTLEALRSLGEVWNAGPPMKHFGARLEFTRVDRVRAVIDPVLPFHRGGLGSEAINGVVLAGLFDLVIGTVGWLTRPDARSATVNLSMSFLRPTMGERVVAEARLLRAGMNLVFASAEISGGSGEVTARCDGTCAVALSKVDSQEIYESMRSGRVAP
jgi:acyl-coenzyme A thioesterase PaaI-like protein